jgi:thymidylate synthase
MHLEFRNVNDVFYSMVWGMHDPGLANHCGPSIPTDVTASRYGEVMVVEEPVIVTYRKPTERVLFNIARDANPFFHVYESLWMLAGRNDVASLTYYNRRMPEFSDEGTVLNGAYGYRWRHALAPMWVGDDIGYPPGSQEAKPIIDEPRSTIVDQLVMIAKHLRASPHSRRAVLSMWNVQDDLLKVDTSKDVCCNLAATFQVGLGDCRHCKGYGGIVQSEGASWLPCGVCTGKPHDMPRYLNMSVFNRSNDLVWGMLGANVVHFSILQEYLAARLGLEVGVYNQMTTNLHAYTETWRPEEWLESPYRDLYDNDARAGQWQWMAERGDNHILSHPLATVPLVRDPDVFDKELPDFVEANAWYCGEIELNTARYLEWREPFLRTVAQPMCSAFHCYRLNQNFKAALRWADLVASEDWRLAARHWLRKRLAKGGIKT